MTNCENTINEKALEELAYFRIRDEIAGFALSEEGKSYIQKRLPFTNLETIEEKKALSRQWEIYLKANRSSPFSSWLPVSHFLSYLSVSGSALDQEQLFSLLQFSVAAIKCAEGIFSSKNQLNIKNLEHLAEKIPYQEIKAVNGTISSILTSSGEIRDLPQLREIRQRISKIQNDINNILKKITSDSAYSNILESTVPVFKGDRQVLAVKASYKNRISGIVSSVSQSGLTLFIEPDEAVRKNNELLEEEARLQSEIRRIFKETTENLSQFKNEIKDCLGIMLEMDASLAAAKWGIENQCNYAVPLEKGDSPRLLKARHLLIGKKAVPLDIKFLGDKKVLIITGPNTGGKTVAIKTFSLCAILNQCGFPLPCAEGTSLPVFDNIFCDIGDEQSIDSSLSTFSAHMKNIADAVENATENSLVLLDELGSGTDPQEGGAIAMAVLDKLIEKKATVLVTTHHGLLKNYGYSHPLCTNASVDFDENTLSPTYRILMGVPGVSHALDIARRSGLKSEIVDKAKNYIDGNEADVGKLIQSLTEKHAEIAKIEAENEVKTFKIRERERKLEEKIFALKEKENALRQKELDGENAFLSQTRKELENLVCFLREGEITREKTLKVKSFISLLTDKIKDSEKQLEEEKEALETERKEAENRINLETEEDRKKGVYFENGILLKEDSRSSKSSKSSKKSKKGKAKSKDAFAQAVAPEKGDYLPLSKNMKTIKDFASKKEPLEFKVGAKVLAGPTKANGVLLKEEKKGFWRVQMGSIKMLLKEKDMILVGNNSAPEKPSITIEMDNSYTGEDSVFKKTPESKESAQFELYLLGMRWDEAKRTLERQLDLCAIENFKDFSIIHGKGNGILQQNVQDFLSHYPTVKEFKFAPPEDGGFGKTYVKLR